MRLWLEFLGGGVSLWLAALPGTDPLLRIGVGAGVIVWGASTAARATRTH